VQIHGSTAESPQRSDHVTSAASWPSQIKYLDIKGNYANIAREQQSPVGRLTFEMAEIECSGRPPHDVTEDAAI